MELRSGYKRTQVGAIPNDWNDLPIQTITTHVGDGLHGTPVYSPNGDYFFINGNNLDRGKIVITKDTKSVGHAEFIKHRKPLSDRSILMSINGTVGNLGLFDGESVVLGKSAAYLNVMAEISKEFVYYSLQTQIAKSQFFDGLTGSTIGNLGLATIRQTRISIPSSEAEQRAIAAALSDVDALLDGLERLIGKKRDLKQATVQQLLTGRTRLPGFSGDWAVKRLIQVAEISTGINKPLSEMGGGALYVTVQDLYDKTSIRNERLSRINVSPSEIEARALIVGDIVFGKSSVKRDGIGYPSRFLGCDELVVFSGFTYRARVRQGVADPNFLFYALREEKTRRWLVDNSQSSALTNINQAIADAIPVQFPPTKTEQTSIANILSDMDAELSAIEARRDKTRALKAAMMQELLTGRTRLVEPASAAAATTMQLAKQDKTRP